MATAVQQRPSELDFDSLEADARGKLEQAEAVEAELSLDALTDPAVADELRNVQSERRSAEDALRQIEQARQEQTRREAEARKQAEAKRKLQALDRARAHQAEREAAARAVDKGAAMLAQALHDLDRAASAQHAALVEAGRDSSSVRVFPLPLSIEAAIALAMREAKAPAGMVSFSGAVHGRLAPLAESDVRPIEPAKGSNSPERSNINGND
jgi:hypothetical protein